MRVIIEARRQTGLPVLLADGGAGRHGRRRGDLCRPAAPGNVVTPVPFTARPRFRESSAKEGCWTAKGKIA
jgi:hypothetical protein